MIAGIAFAIGYGLMSFIDRWDELLWEGSE